MIGRRRTAAPTGDSSGRTPLGRAPVVVETATGASGSLFAGYDGAHLDAATRAELTKGFLPGADDETSAPRDRVDALDGVRALAVGLVVLFHLGVPGLSGGYLGVDTFFVLSGFLITTLLLKDIVAHGRIDLARFWARRMARLMPAVLLLMLVVGIWALTGAPAFRRSALGADILWCLAYLGNWHFIQSASYFVYDGTLSPLTQLWSLAVEEQFYVVWPLVLQAVAFLLASMSYGRHARRDLLGARRRSTIAVMITGALLAVASIVAMVHAFTSVGPDRAYMGTDAKVFEPLLGAVFAAALLRDKVSALVDRFAGVLTLLGTAGLLVAVALLGSDTGATPAYFHGGAVAASLSVVALVAGATRVSPTGFPGVIFSNKVAAYLGRISYGLYLWHWPWAVWLMPHGEFVAERALLVVFLTVGSAAASYHLLEMPLREGRARRARPARILTAGLAAMAAWGIVPVALGATPLLAGVSGSSAAASGQSKLMIVGDSVPNQLFGSFADAGEKSGVTVVNGAHGGCGASGAVTLNADGTVFDPLIPRMPSAQSGPVCAGTAQDQRDRLDKEHPNVVLWWSRYEYADFLGPNGKPLRPTDPGYRDYQVKLLNDAVDRLTATGATLVIVRPEPAGLETAKHCTADRHDMAGECATLLVRMRFDDAQRQQWISLLERKAQQDSRVRIIRVEDQFCRDDKNPCDDRLPLVSNGTFPPASDQSSRPDGAHFAASARDQVARETLRRAVAAAAGH